MAYMNQERKAALSPAIKAICKKYGVKATLSVHHYSTLVLNISAGDIDFFGDSISQKNSTYMTVNEHWYQDHFTGRSKEFLSKVIPAMMVGNHDRSDIMTDYFDVGWYIDVNIGRWNKPYKLTGHRKNDMNAQELLDRLMELSKSGVNLTSLKVVVPCNGFHPTAADAIDGEFILD